MSKQTKGIFPKLLLVSMFLGMCILFGVGVHTRHMNAYFSDTDEAMNRMVIGNNKIRIEEVFQEPFIGEKTIKEPKVENTGSVDCYVRGRILLSDSRAEIYLKYFNEEHAGINTTDWEADSDGWIYYKNVLKVGETTAPVFTHIKLAEEFPQILEGFTVDLVFESIQVNEFSNSKEAFASLAEKGGVS